MIAIHMPVFGRPELTEKVVAYYRTLPALLVIVGEEEYPCDIFVKTPNEPLGAKLNAGMTAIEDEKVDGVMCVGSDDLVSPKLFDEFSRAAKAGYTVGLLDTYIADLSTKKAIHWEGYAGEREGETVGAGRCFGLAMLSWLMWKPWYDDSTHAMDEYMTRRMAEADLTITGVTMDKVGAPMVCMKAEQCLNPMSWLEGDPVEDPFKEFPVSWETFR